MDILTFERIGKVHPKLRDELIRVISSCNLRLHPTQVRITQGFRSFAEQDKLFAQGRTRPGIIVTNAKGGQSYHNYGLAVDFALLQSGRQVIWDLTADLDADGRSDWMEVVEEFEKAGWSWGGYWKRPDYPHFEKTFGYNFRQLRTMLDAGKVDQEGYVDFS